MGLLSIFNRKSTATPAATGGDAAQVVAVARTRARRRLVGAVVLLGIGVIAFPLLFETQPRPIPVDIPIEIPRKDSVPPLVVPPVRPAPAAAPAPAPAPSPVVSQVGEPRATDAAAAASAAAAVAPSPPPASKVVEAKVPAKPPAPVEPKALAEGPGRFVVQLGAFADASGVRDTRAKVDKLGLHTYTQTIDTDKGKRTRVRVGPFASRDEAEQVAAKVKAAGLQAAVLTL